MDNVNNIRNMISNVYNGLVLDACYNPKDKDARILSKGRRQAQFETYITSVLCDMLDFKNLPETVNARFLNFYLLRFGYAIIVKHNNEWICSTGSFIPPLDVYGIGKKFQYVTLNGEEGIAEINKDCVVFLNNNLYQSEYFHIRYLSGVLSNTDISIDTLIANTRYVPVLSTSDQKVKKSLEECFKQQSEGARNVIECDFQNIFGENFKPFEILDICDFSQIEKIQYLLNIHNDIKTRLYNWYGFSKNSSPKLAQQSEKEVRETDGLCFLYPLERLKLAKESIEKCNQLFGFNSEVQFGECWNVSTELDEKILNKGGAKNDDKKISESSGDISDHRNTETVQ